MGGGTSNQYASIPAWVRAQLNPQRTLLNSTYQNYFYTIASTVLLLSLARFSVGK